MKTGDIIKISWYGRWTNCIVESAWLMPEGWRVSVEIPEIELTKGLPVKWEYATRWGRECRIVKNPNRIKNDIIRNALFKRQAELLEAEK